MKRWMIGCSLALAVSLSACTDGEKMTAVTTIDSDFESGTDGWSADFSDYSTATDTATLALRSRRALLPSPLDNTRYGILMQGSNRSDDLFMFVKKKIKGFRPGGTYNVAFDIDFATNESNDSFGAGGAPGTSVYLKAGASPNEPAKKLVGDYYNFTLDKGQQSQGGKEMAVIGNASNDSDETVYKIVKRSSADNSVTVNANASGEIWLCVGTDSGYEGISVFYYDRIKATISEKISN
ncbi:hypothetical protein DYBT9275_01232 [Dyadobacter sp. CECT 9275]|uniref:Lipoprotein n=1 Tax=Dyadobacter helix TaxID=2822344 RepID=A0A916JBN2_9BACT|nr:hypothetical protein [Dyadobacter sp. CECT 9275]CAG4993776.1 hypothetical protein DYBT9275_01232 [Dyadobacter sp. CECT 9275]